MFTSNNYSLVVSFRLFIGLLDFFLILAELFSEYISSGPHTPQDFVLKTSFSFHLLIVRCYYHL
jgi:hypothetical protein